MTSSLDRQNLRMPGSTATAFRPLGYQISQEALRQLVRRSGRTYARAAAGQLRLPQRAERRVPPLRVFPE